MTYSSECVTRDTMPAQHPTRTQRGLNRDQITSRKDDARQTFGQLADTRASSSTNPVTTHRPMSERFVTRDSHANNPVTSGVSHGTPSRPVPTRPVSPLSPVGPIECSIPPPKLTLGMCAIRRNQ